MSCTLALRTQSEDLEGPFQTSQSSLPAAQPLHWPEASVGIWDMFSSTAFDFAFGVSPFHYNSSSNIRKECGWETVFLSFYPTLSLTSISL